MQRSRVRDPSDEAKGEYGEALKIKCRECFGLNLIKIFIFFKFIYSAFLLDLFIFEILSNCRGSFVLATIFFIFSMRFYWKRVQNAARHRKIIFRRTARLYSN